MVKKIMILSINVSYLDKETNEYKDSVIDAEVGLEDILSKETKENLYKYLTEPTDSTNYVVKEDKNIQYI